MTWMNSNLAWEKQNQKGGFFLPWIWKMKFETILIKSSRVSKWEKNKMVKFRHISQQKNGVKHLVFFIYPWVKSSWVRQKGWKWTPTRTRSEKSRLAAFWPWPQEAFFRPKRKNKQSNLNIFHIYYMDSQVQKSKAFYCRDSTVPFRLADSCLSLSPFVIYDRSGRKQDFPTVPYELWSKKEPFSSNRRKETSFFTSICSFFSTFFWETLFLRSHFLRHFFPRVKFFQGEEGKKSCFLFQFVYK